MTNNIAIISKYLWLRQDFTNKIFIILSICCTLTTIFLNLSLPLIFREMINHLDQEQYIHSNILLLLLGYGVIWLATRYLEKLQEILFFRPVLKATTDYCLDVFCHIQNQSLRFHLNRETGQISAAIQKAQTSIPMIASNLLFRITPTFIEAFFAFIILWHIVGFNVGAALIVTLIAYLAGTSTLMQVFMKADETYQRIDTQVDKRIIDSLLNSENIKFLNAEQHEVNIADKNIRERENAILNVFWAGTFSTTFQAVVLGVGLIGINYIVTTQVLRGVLQPSDFIMVNSYLLMLFTPLESITGHIRNTIANFSDLSHSVLLLEQSDIIANKANANDLILKNGDIDFHNLTFSYQPELSPILKEFNLKIKGGSTIGIVGYSGCGKSTLLRLLFRLYDPVAGYISIDEQDIKYVTKESLREYIAFVPQDIILLHDTLKANLTYGSSYSDKELFDAIAAADLEQLIINLPEGIETIVGERGLKLSGGERQRIAIARALLKKPKIIIFDEATSSLDTNSEKKIQSSVYESNPSITKIIIAHRLQTVISADQIIFIHNGKVTEKGTHQNLLALNGHYKLLWEKQYAQL